MKSNVPIIRFLLNHHQVIINERLNINEQCYLYILHVYKSKENHFAFQLDTRRLQCKFSRNVFSSLYVVNQIDQKFIGCLATDDVGTKYLILIDQHAAHERICLEKLIRRELELLNFLFAAFIEFFSL